jgi:hypothetical protein
VGFRTDTETAADFLGQVMPAARELGLAAVQFSGVAAVPPEEKHT